MVREISNRAGKNHQLVDNGGEYFPLNWIKSVRFTSCLIPIDLAPPPTTSRVRL